MRTKVHSGYVVSDRILGSFIPFGTFVGLLDDGKIGFLGNSKKKNQSDLFIGVATISEGANYYVNNERHDKKKSCRLLAGYKSGDLITVALGCKVGVRYGIDEENNIESNTSVYIGKYFELDNQNGLVSSDNIGARLVGSYVNKIYSDYAIITLNNYPSKLEFK